MNNVNIDTKKQPVSTELEGHALVKLIREHLFSCNINAERVEQRQPGKYLWVFRSTKFSFLINVYYNSYQKEVQMIAEAAIANLTKDVETIELFKDLLKVGHCMSILPFRFTINESDQLLIQAQLCQCYSEALIEETLNNLGALSEEVFKCLSSRHHLESFYPEQKKCA